MSCGGGAGKGVCAMYLICALASAMLATLSWNVARDAMAADEEDRPRKKITHEIGQDLALLSVGELNERIALLQQEIERLQAAATSKEASRSAADKFFKS
jgi:uncharacterized small protein (DUF1192 family)